MSERENETTTEEQSGGFGDGVAEGGGGEQGRPPETGQAAPTEGGTVDPSP